MRTRLLDHLRRPRLARSRTTRSTAADADDTDSRGKSCIHTHKRGRANILVQNDWHEPERFLDTFLKRSFPNLDYPILSYYPIRFSESENPAEVKNAKLPWFYNFNLDYAVEGRSIKRENRYGFLILNYLQ